MAERGVAEPDRRHLAARNDLAGQHLAVEQRDDALQRAHPLHRAAAPSHRPGPRQRFHGSLDDAGQHFRGRAAFLLDDREPELALPGVALFGLVEGTEAGALEETLDRLVGRPNSRSALFFADVGPRNRQPVYHKSQPPWRREGPRLGEGQSRSLQAIADQPLQILGRTRLHARGNLFAPEFKEKLGHLKQPLPSVSRARPRSRLWRGRARAECSSAAR